MQIIFRVIFLFLYSCYAHATPSQAIQWLNSKSTFAHEKIFANLSPADGLPGSVMAAQPAKTGPNYHYHWVRDAALTMLSLLDSYRAEPSVTLKGRIRHALFDYLEFSTLLQNQHTSAGLGEPKFYLNGTPYQEPWGRPQNDGPALRAVSLIELANILIAEGDEELVKQKLYRSEMPATSPIKKDLEYISHHWQDPSYDLWEESEGTHFYTLMVIRRALYEGAALALHMQDKGAAEWYLKQAKYVELSLDLFWDDKNGYFKATINQTGGINHKDSLLDTAVILGLLHGESARSPVNWNDPRVWLTMQKLILTFKNLYPVNHGKIPGIAVGRYPEDRYDGDQFQGGNPWPLCTLAIAEALYKMAAHGAKQDVKLADTLVERVKYHAYTDGAMDEQIDRQNGFMTSAHDLTWNYAALLTTRRAALKVNS